ncbi:MAG: hypothetical protein ACTSV7_09065 [Candidatus Baldrarchaeia archaeon]
MNLEDLVNQLDVIDVWNCRGTVKNSKWGVGYGCQPDLPKGLKWEKIGYFIIPIPADIQLNDTHKAQIEEVLGQIVDRDGAINMSGWYPIEDSDRERLLKAFKGQLVEADLSAMANKILGELKAKPMCAFLTHSSGWSCWEGCQGYHSNTYIFWDGEKWQIFTVGCHHAWCNGMWDITPQEISEKEATNEIIHRLEHETRTEKVYEDEVDDWIENLLWYLDEYKIEYCKTHNTYYWENEGCPECSTEES